MRRALVAILLLLLLLGGSAVGAYAVLQGSAPLRASGPELDPRLARYHLLVPGERATFAVTWNDGAPPVFTYFRNLRGWQILRGVPHARLEWTYPTRRGDRVCSVEWLRPGTDAQGAATLLCARRQVGLATHSIEPPMPVLRTPLTPGASWSWEGTVGGQPARATFRILEPGEGGTLRVEQTSHTGAHRSVRVQEYAPGRGLVAEVGTFPVLDYERRQDRMRAKRVDG